MKGFLTGILLSAVLCAQQVHAQDDNEMHRPRTSGVENIDAFMNKAFDIYDEIIKISYDVGYYRVEINNGLTKSSITKMKVMNGNGDPIDKAMATDKFNQLLSRLKNQHEQIEKLSVLEKSATQEKESASFLKRMKISKEYETATKARNYVVDETKKEMELLTKYLNLLKSDKTVMEH